MIIDGTDLPGPSCGPHRNVHVALQVGSQPEGITTGGADRARWTTEVRVVAVEDGRDFRGPAVHGKRGERFLYLTWGELDGERFAVFRRAKLMLADSPVAESVVAHVRLTDGQGMPVCARLRPPAVRWATA